MAKAKFGGAINSMEEHLSELTRPDRPTLRLKNGSEVDAKIAYVTWQMLEARETRRPEELQALVAIAQGNESSVTPGMRKRLREHDLVYFDRDGAMEPVVREVIKSAYRFTPDGPVLVFPFQITTQGDKDIFNQVQREDDQILSRRRRDGNDDQGRSR